MVVRRQSQKVDNPPLDVVDSPDLPPLHQVFGASRVSTGVWEIPVLSAELASPDAALHIGPQHIVLEACANELATRLAGCELQIDDWYVMFVNRGKTGPFRTCPLYPSDAPDDLTRGSHSVSRVVA